MPQEQYATIPGPLSCKETPVSLPHVLLSGGGGGDESVWASVIAGRGGQPCVDV